jgi:hypothetical protein
MGNLTLFLQHEFTRWCPPDWTCRHETAVLPPELTRMLGFAPRADVLLERRDGSRRLWIEFEVSRADPVANHAKFATAHLFDPQPPTDAFVSMVSPHVTRGRRNLAAMTIALMRHVGMNAFQTALLPHLTSREVQRLNHIPVEQLDQEQLGTATELQRAMCVAEPIACLPGGRIHLAGDLLSVMLNVRQWNQDLGTGRGAETWGRRTVTYFVFDPQENAFAPSKFCAYVAIPSGPDQVGASMSRLATMTVEVYTQAADAVGRRLDGHEARDHLTRNLAMIITRAEAAPPILAHFSRWFERHRDRLRVHPAGPLFLIPPEWFR